MSALVCQDCQRKRSNFSVGNTRLSVFSSVLGRYSTPQLSEGQGFFNMEFFQIGHQSTRYPTYVVRRTNHASDRSELKSSCVEIGPSCFDSPSPVLYIYYGPTPQGILFPTVPNNFYILLDSLIIVACRP